MNTMNEPLASKYFEIFNFPEYSREEHLNLSKGKKKRIRMVKKNSDNEKFLLYIHRDIISWDLF